MNGVLFYFLLGVLGLGCLSICATLERQLDDQVYASGRRRLRVWQWATVIALLFGAVALSRLLPG